MTDLSSTLVPETLPTNVVPSLSSGELTSTRYVTRLTKYVYRKTLGASSR